MVDLETLENDPGFIDGETQASQRHLVSQLLDRIYCLKPLDREVMLLYLEGESATSIAEVTGISEANVATRVHRIKRLLKQQSGEGKIHAGE